MSKFLYPSEFSLIAVGTRFVEVMSTCDEVAIRIEPTTHQGKPANAQRYSRKLIFMADWEPVLITEEGPDFYQFYWECPECEKPVHISVDECECEMNADET